MSTIERVAVTFGTKRNMGDYNSMELTLYLEARVDEGEDAMAVARELHERAVAEVKAQYRLRRPPRNGEHVREALADPDGGEGAARNRERGIPIDGVAVDPPNFIPGYLSADGMAWHGRAHGHGHGEGASDA